MCLRSSGTLLSVYSGKLSLATGTLSTEEWCFYHDGSKVEEPPTETEQ